MNQREVMKRDNVLVAFLAEHRGAGNLVSTSQICGHLNECGYKTQKDHIHSLIRKLMFERTLPICSINSKGYYWAETKDEIQMAIDEMQSRISEMQNRIELLKKFILN